MRNIILNINLKYRTAWKDLESARQKAGTITDPLDAFDIDEFMTADEIKNQLRGLFHGGYLSYEEYEI